MLFISCLASQLEIESGKLGQKKGGHTLAFEYDPPFFWLRPVCGTPFPKL